jgi:hypothetical protein
MTAVERRLKMEIHGVGRGVEIVARGKCGEYPCRVDGWRCPTCTRAMSEAYKGIIIERFDQYKVDVDELGKRNLQVIHILSSQELFS